MVITRPLEIFRGGSGKQAKTTVNMNSMTIIVFVAVAIVAVSSMPQFATRGVIPVLQRDEARDDHGQFSLRYITGDGTTVTEQGKLTPNSDGSDLVLVKEGSYTYTSPEGKTVTIRYKADENGFQPSGDAIPVAPVV